MNQDYNTNNSREFVKNTALITGGAIGFAILSQCQLFSGRDDVIKIALVGCGGRGTGAATQALRKQNVNWLRWPMLSATGWMIAIKQLTSDELESLEGNVKDQK